MLFQKKELTHYLKYHKYKNQNCQSIGGRKNNHFNKKNEVSIF